MSQRTYSGEDLEDAIESEELTTKRFSLCGFVKSSEKREHVSFSVSNGREWIEIPIEMIKESKEVPEMSRINPDYPTVDITFEEPEDDQSTVLYDLFASVLDSLSRGQTDLSVTGGQSGAVTQRQMGGGFGISEYSCCKPGEAYPCGCLPGGEVMICCDEWVPCPVIKNPPFQVLSR